MPSFVFPFIVINFADPLTVAQQNQIATLIGKPTDKLIEVPFEFDPKQLLSLQVVEAVNELGLTYTEWNTSEIVVKLPNDSAVAATLLAEIHGRMGYFPGVLRLRKVQDSTSQHYEIFEIINLWAQSDSAKFRR